MKANCYQYKFKNGILSYQLAGKGEKILLAFHGFGQDKSAFDILVDQIGNSFTIYSFDLFFHGDSQWDLGDKPISKEEWTTILSEFLKQEGITKFSLLGFSIGAKLVLTTFESFPSGTESLYLVAPDGVKTNFWYTLATGSNWLRKYFKSLILRPDRFKGLAKLASSFRLVNPQVLRFAASQMETEAQRSQVYYSWVVFSKLKFSISKIAKLLNESSADTLIIVGSRDKIITAHSLKKLTDKVPKIQVEIVDAGHNNLISKSVKVLENKLKKSS